MFRMFRRFLYKDIVPNIKAEMSSMQAIANTPFGTKERTRPRRIFFIPMLVDRLRSQDPPKVTYRTTAKRGVYRVVQGNWLKPLETEIVLEFYKVEVVNPLELSEEEVRLCGAPDKASLLLMLVRWYGKVPTSMYRNWFNVKGGEN